MMLSKLNRTTFKISSSCITFLLHFVMAMTVGAMVTPVCRNFCNNIPIKYPFGIDDGCGAALFRPMLNCSGGGGGLFFLTPSGSYKIQTIDYARNTLVVFDPSMSTCSILQPHHDFLMTDIQSATIPPSPDTVFVLINCSLDSPLLNHYSSLCFNFSGHSCDELYGACPSFRLFFSRNNMLSNSTLPLPPPPCCFTRYNTVKLMSMNILDCTHYTSVYNVDGLPLDWLYGIKLSYGLPDLGCERCAKSGGTCGFDVETKGFLCICSATRNSTVDCGLPGNGVQRQSYGVSSVSVVLLLRLFAFVFIVK